MPWRERLTNSSLVISNLTAEDSGLYIWRVYGTVAVEIKKGVYEFQHVCSVGSIRLVYRDPYGVDSVFYRAYASLTGCGLLGLVGAVIWFKLRSKRGEQSGDVDLFENVEMDEIND